MTIGKHQSENLEKPLWVWPKTKISSNHRSTDIWIPDLDTWYFIEFNGNTTTITYLWNDEHSVTIDGGATWRSGSGGGRFLNLPRGKYCLQVTDVKPTDGVSIYFMRYPKTGDGYKFDAERGSINTSASKLDFEVDYDGLTCIYFRARMMDIITVSGVTLEEIQA